MIHSPAMERRSERRTRAATAKDAEAAAAAVTGDAGHVGQWGPVVDWPVVGVHAALLANGKVLAYDSVGDQAAENTPSTTAPGPRSGTRPRHADAGQPVGVQHLLQRAGAPHGRVHLRRRRNKNAQLEGSSRRTSSIRPATRGAGAGHGGGALVSERHPA